MFTPPLLLIAALIQGSGNRPIRNDPLLGFGPTAVVVEHMVDALSSSCAVRWDAVEQSASRSLADGGIRIDPNASSLIYVNANVKLIGQSCVASISVSAQTEATGVLRYGRGDPVPVTVLLWNRETIVSALAANFGERVNAFVRDAVEQFVVKVKVVNHDHK